MARKYMDARPTAEPTLLPSTEAAIGEPRSLVDAVDRITCQVSDPVAGLRFFAVTLGLPVRIPLHETARSSSALLLLGNTALEMLHLPDDRLLPLRAAPGTLRIRMLSAAATPTIPIDRIPAALQRLGFPLMTSKVHEGPIPDILRPHTPDDIARSSRPRIATTVTVHGVVQPPEDTGTGATIQIIDHAHDVERRRIDEHAVLERHHGGPLGLLGVHTVLAEVDDVEDGLGRWIRFLHPARPSGFGRWAFAGGPSLAMTQGVADRWAGLLLRVRSLNGAVAHLHRHDIPCATQHGLVEIAPSSTFGLRLALTDQDWATPVRLRLHARGSQDQPPRELLRDIASAGQASAPRRFDA